MYKIIITLTIYALMLLGTFILFINYEKATSLITKIVAYLTTITIGIASAKFLIDNPFTTNSTLIQILLMIHLWILIILEAYIAFNLLKNN